MDKRIDCKQHTRNDLSGSAIFIHILYRLFGDIENITARFNVFSHASIIEFEDTGIVNFYFVNGGVECLNFSTLV